MHPTYKVVVTGHSLGGAIATLAGAYLRKLGVAVDIYTFGSPRVGDTAFANFVSSQKNGFTARITQKLDPVTAVPGLVAGFAHTTPEFWFETGLALAGPLKLCQGSANVACSAQRSLLITHAADHSEYEGSFHPCSASGKGKLGGLFGRGGTLQPLINGSLTQDIGSLTQEDVDTWLRNGIIDPVAAPGSDVLPNEPSAQSQISGRAEALLPLISGSLAQDIGSLTQEDVDTWLRNGIIDPVAAPGSDAPPN